MRPAFKIVLLGESDVQAFNKLSQETVVEFHFKQTQ